MSVFGKRSHQVAVALLVTMFLWHAESVAGQLTLNWIDNSTAELGFSVERSIGTTGTFAEIGTTSAGVTQYVDSMVLDGTTYCYRVRAFDTSTYSAYSNVACGATAQAVALSVAKTGTGSGAVISTPSGIICGSSCSGSFSSGTTVTLSASATTGSAFKGWSGGGCSGTGSCTVTVTSTTTVTATFDLVPMTLSVSMAGTGSGTVSSTPAGIMCGSTCSASFPYGTSVSLTAVVPAGSTFTGWSGGCIGIGSCTVSPTSPTSVTATFAQQTQMTTLRVAVSGQGVVTSTPAGISCSKGTCLAQYAVGTGITLTATPKPGASFKNWSGACIGKNPTCTMILNGSSSAKANFTKR